MKLNRLTGWQQVYQFTFSQTIKTKSIRIMTIILCTIALLSMPVAHLVSTLINKNTTEEIPIDVVYIIDESELGEVDYSSLRDIDNFYKDTEFQVTKKSKEEITEDLIKTDKNHILLHIVSLDGTYQLQFVKAPKSSLTDDSLNQFSSLIMELFNRNRIESLEISDEQLGQIYAPISTEVAMIEYDGEGTPKGDWEDPTQEGKEDDSMPMNEYFLVLGVIVVVVMFFAFGGEGVASSIITEKSTRVIEYLLTSIRPLAIIVGKVLAMLTVTLLQFVLIGISVSVSNLITKSLLTNSKSAPSLFDGELFQSILSNINGINVLITVLLYIGGFLFFGLLAGLAGAMVSKIEELAEGIMVFNMFLILGAYLGIAVAMMSMSGNGDNPIAYVGYLLPISSIFITPTYVFLGKISLIWGLLALLILTISLILLAMFTANIYESLILHQGNRLKLKDLISISKQRKEERG
jgi:ABC-2 type transport system permease protein